MIEVTKHGNNNQVAPREGRCDKCGCEFTYTREDCYWSRPLLTYILICPECREKVWLGDVFDE